MKILNWFLDNFELALILAVSAISSALVSLGYISEKQIPITTLTLLITIAIFLAIKNYRVGTKIHSISKSVSSIEEKVAHLIAAKVLYGREACFNQLNSVITKNSKIDATYFTPEPPPSEEDQGAEEKEYWSKSWEYLKSSKEFRVRRMVTVENPEKLNWVKNTFKKVKNCPHYHLAVLSTEQSFPYMNLIVIDNRYTMLFGPHTKPSDKRQYTFIDDNTIAASFVLHFEGLWLKTVALLKDGTDIYPDNFKKIEERLNGNQNP